MGLLSQNDSHVIHHSCYLLLLHRLVAEQSPISFTSVADPGVVDIKAQDCRNLEKLTHESCFDTKSSRPEHDFYYWPVLEKLTVEGIASQAKDPRVSREYSL